MAGQAHEIAVCGFRLHAGGIRMVIEEAVQAKLHGQPLHAFGGRVGETRLDVGDRVLRPHDRVFARCNLHSFERRQPVLKQA